jgi:hypothetical protein
MLEKGFTKFPRHTVSVDRINKGAFGEAGLKGMFCRAKNQLREELVENDMGWIFPFKNIESRKCMT